MRLTPLHSIALAVALSLPIGAAAADRVGPVAHSAIKPSPRLPDVVPACPTLSSYQIQRTDLVMVKVRDALDSLLAGTAYTASVDDSLAKMVVSAYGVGGPLSMVLADFIAHLNERHELTWTLKGCELRVGPSLREADPWLLEAGKRIDTQLEAWARLAGWRLFWNAPVSWEVLADTVLYGTFDEALVAVIEGLAAENRPVRLVLSPNNNVAEVFLDEKK